MSARAYTSAHARTRLRGALTPAQVVDLILVAELMIIVPGLLLVDVPWIRIPTGLFATLAAPGYALAAALFPSSDDLDGATRAALSLGLSVALIPLLALLLDASPWGLAALPLAMALCAVTCVACVAAGVRRYFRGTPAALLAPAPRKPGLWNGHRAAFAAALLVALWGAAVYSSVLSTPTRLTEFYVLGAGGQATAYPREAVAGEPLTVALGVTNQEGALRSYYVEIHGAGAMLARTGVITLADGERWDTPVSFSLPAVGADQAVELLLFVEGQSEPYRRLRLWLDVGGRP